MDGVVAESVLAVTFALQLAYSVVLILISAFLTTASFVSLGLSELVPYGLAIGIGTGLLLIFAYFWSYAPARNGYYLRARTPTLVLGIIFVLLIFTVVLGVLYIFAYRRLRDAGPGIGSVY